MAQQHAADGLVIGDEEGESLDDDEDAIDPDDYDEDEEEEEEDDDGEEATYVRGVLRRRGDSEDIDMDH